MAARFPMAVVVVGSPLTVTIEGASAVVAAEDFVGGLTTGNRVQAAFLGDRLVVFAKAGGAADTGWVGITFEAGYQQFDSSDAFKCQVRRIGGIVYTRGLMRPTSGSFASSTTHVVATMPSGFRPASVIYAAMGGNFSFDTASVVYRNSGIVEVRTSAGGTPPYIGFGGTSWPVD